MAFNKQQKKIEYQIEFKNMTHDAPFNPFKNYYGIVEHEGSEKVFEYEGKFRSEAEAYFQEKARLLSGKFKMMGVLK